MLVKKWEKLPVELQNEEVRKYYEILRKKNFSLFLKRLFDIVVSALLLVLLSPTFLILAIAVKLTAKVLFFTDKSELLNMARGSEYLSSARWFKTPIAVRKLP